MVTQTQISDFRAQGAVLLKGVLNDHIDEARQAIEQNIATPSWRERTYRPEDGTAPFFQDYVVWNQFDGYRNLVKKSPLAEIAAQLMSSETARIFHDHILVKEPGNSIVTPWHQDQPYYLVDGAQNVSFWIPLDPISRDRTIEYISGSHLWGKSFKPKRFDGSDLFEGDTSESIPDIDARRQGSDQCLPQTQFGDSRFHESLDPLFQETKLDDAVLVNSGRSASPGMLRRPQNQYKIRSKRVYFATK